jgi:hypothetical protein
VTYDLPDSWASLFDRLAQALGGVAGRVDGLFYEEAQAWYQEAVSVLYGVATLRDLDRATRQRAFQRAAATLLVVQEHGDLAFRFGIRELLRQSFARTWEGATVEGPPWRLDPTETDLPTYADWSAGDEFGTPPSPASQTVR